MDKITFTPSSIRGGGDVLEDREVSDFLVVNSTLTSSTQTVLDDECTVFNLDFETVDSFSALLAELANKNITSLVNGLSFQNNSILYDTVPLNNVSSIYDLIGVIYNLQFDSTNNGITYDTFDGSDMTVLENALTSLTYDSTNYQIKYDIVGELNV